MLTMKLRIIRSRIGMFIRTIDSDIDTSEGLHIYSHSRGNVILPADEFSFTENSVLSNKFHI